MTSYQTDAEATEEHNVASKGLARNTLIMGIGTMLSRVTGFGRSVALVYALGAGALSDSYSLANNIPNVVYELIVGGILSATLVPVFANRLRTQSHNDAWHGISAVTTLASAAVIVSSLLIYATAPYLIALYSVFSHGEGSQSNQDTAVFLLRFFAPQVAFYGFISIATAILQARRTFGPPMFAPIFNNLVAICMFLLIPHVVANPSPEALQADRGALILLGIGTTAGVAAMALALVPSMVRIARGHLKLVWDVRHEAVRTVISMSGWTIGLVITNQIAMWITLALSYSDQGGSTAIILTAYTFFILPHGVFSVSLMNALQPELAEHWAVQELREYRAKVIFGIRVILTVMMPVVVFFAFLSLPLMEVALSHGNMTLDKAHLTGYVVIAMMVGLPFFSVFIFLTRAFQAMQDAKSVFILYAILNLVHVVVALPFFHAFGVTGLALAQSLSYLVGAVLALAALRHRVGQLRIKALVFFLFRLTIPLAVLAGTLAICAFTLADHEMIFLAVATLLGCVVYFVVARIARIPEIHRIWNALLTRSITKRATS